MERAVQEPQGSGLEVPLPLSEMLIFQVSEKRGYLCLIQEPVFMKAQITHSTPPHTAQDGLSLSI